MNAKLITALILLCLSVGGVFLEFYFVNNTANELSAALAELDEYIAKDDFSTAEESFKSFTDKYSEKEKVLSVFLHDDAIDNIHTLLNRIEGLIALQIKDEIITEIEALGEEIDDLLESIMPNLRNIM